MTLKHTFSSREEEAMEDAGSSVSLEMIIFVIFMIPALLLGSFLVLYVILEVAPDYPLRSGVELESLLRPQLWNHNATHDLPYQDYITPSDPAITQLSNLVNGKVEAYRAAVSWVWVSDATLHGEEEKWLTPHVFLQDTPGYQTNPAKPRQASDCEEQANTLVSLLRAEGVSAENVRVVLGEVDFGMEAGGHAWVEVYENGEWLALEATSGPYFDDNSQIMNERKGMSYTYYETRAYPSVEIWFYYNDVYYSDFIHDEENAPGHWFSLHATGVINIGIYA